MVIPHFSEVPRHALQVYEIVESRIVNYVKMLAYSKS